jgi:hypothetical protein
MVWNMNGGSLPVTASYLPSRGINFSIVGAGDYNSDGMTDVLWHNPLTGEVSAWLMNGVNISSGAWIGTMSDPVWKIAGEE